MSDTKSHPTTKQEALAQELAERLQDPEGLGLYVKVAHKYSEACIRSILGLVLEVPPRKIRRSRGALFNWLMHHHADCTHTADAAARPRD